MKTSGDNVATAGGNRKRRLVKRVGQGLAGIIWPQRSLITHRELAGPGALETSRWAKLRSVRLSVEALKRARATPIRGGLSAEGRRRNVKGAFRVRTGRKTLVAGKRTLLADDVMTAGATADACALTLKRAGPTCVDVITLARVAGPRSVPI